METLIQTAIFKRRKSFATQGLEITSVNDPPCTRHNLKQIIFWYRFIYLQRNHVFVFYSIYEKLIQFCGIDELGTNYPKVCNAYLFIPCKHTFCFVKYNFLCLLLYRICLTPMAGQRIRIMRHWVCFAWNWIRHFNSYGLNWLHLLTICVLSSPKPKLRRQRWTSWKKPKRKRPRLKPWGTPPIIYIIFYFWIILKSLFVLYGPQPHWWLQWFFFLPMCL